MNKKNLVFFLIVVILLLTSTLLWQGSGQVLIRSSQLEYDLAAEPIITIQNGLQKNLCFSECYRYYLEKKNGEWQSYLYGDCQDPDLIKRCIEPGEAVGFALIIDFPEPGLHRAALPVCLGCEIGDYFKEDQRFYSNEFLIK